MAPRAPGRSKLPGAACWPRRRVPVWCTACHERWSRRAWPMRWSRWTPCRRRSCAISAYCPPAAGGGLRMRNPAAAKQPEPPPNRLAAGGAPSDELGYAYFLRAVRRLTGVNLEHYRQGQLRRRLDALLQRVGARGYLEYARLLERDPARLQEFRDYFTINVTEFFRDPDRFRYLEQRVLPELLRGRAGLNVWSAACSTGAEPYSVAILLRELAPRGPHRILATDVDRTVLARAQRGTDYGPSELRNVSPERLARHFRPGPTARRGPCALRSGRWSRSASTTCSTWPHAAAST